MALPFRSGATLVTRTNITATALSPTQLVSCFDTLTRFLAARVDRVAFWIFQCLWIHQDASDWAECRQDARDPGDQLRSMAGTFILFLARERIGGHRGTDQVMLLIDPARFEKDFNLYNRGPSNTRSKRSFRPSWEQEGELQDRRLCEWVGFYNH